MKQTNRIFEIGHLSRSKFADQSFWNKLILPYVTEPYVNFLNLIKNTFVEIKKIPFEKNII